MSTLRVVFAALFCFIFSTAAWARPEYAVKNGIVNCAACHVSPSGAGIRNQNGKLYQMRNLGTTQTAMNALFQGDARFVAYIPPHPYRIGSSGVVLMSSIAAVSIPIVENQANGSESRFVFAYDFGMLNPNEVRDAYLIHRFHSTADTGALSSVSFGRFQVIPFGLLTDEHRTYVRLQTKTAFHANMNFGASLAGDPSHQLHYDVALLTAAPESQGANSAGTAFGPKNILTYGMLFNVRYNPRMIPAWFGASYMNFRFPDYGYRPYAGSLYAGLSGTRLSGGKVPLTVLAEVALAHGFNDTEAGVVNDNISKALGLGNAGFLAGIKDSQSLGVYVEADYELTNRWTLQYKFDEYVAHRQFLGDAFIRNSFGFKYFFNGATSLWARYELSKAKNAAFTEQNTQAARNNLFLLLHVSI